MIWQRRAWEYFDLVGEIGFAFGLFGNVTSRARLYPAIVVDPHQPPVQLKNVEDLPEDFTEACRDALGRITSSTGGSDRAAARRRA